MILLLIFAFLAGVVTILSPCILPILPIILSSGVGGVETGKSRPLCVVTGFVASFTFFTLFLSTIVRLIGIPADSLRIFAVVVIAGFGISLLVPKIQYLLEILFSKLSQFIPRGNTKSGFWPGVLIGLSLGLLWTPCVGPILASVISLAITGTVTFDAFLITLAYSLGTAIPMFLIMLGGQNALKKVPWLLANTGKIQKIFGVIMIITALGILTQVDRKFQTFILEKFPRYGANLTKFEDNPAVGEILKEKTTQPKGIKAPELIPGGQWFNSEPITLESVRGKVVIIDFWTYSCINCQRTFPYLRKWHETYKDKGLVIIGVHSPEFEFEKNPKNLEKAIADFKLTYPIVQDNNFATWRAYQNRYWPAKYFIDKDGNIRYTHFGEGAYDESENVIRELLQEAGSADLPEAASNPKYLIYAKTPEIYLGSERFSEEHVSFEGDWVASKEYRNPKKGAKLSLNFEAMEVFLVMRSSAGISRLKVFLDDNFEQEITVDSDRLYKLISLPAAGRHILRLEFEDSNSQLFAFTFG